MKTAKCCRRCSRRFTRTFEYRVTLLGPVCRDTDLCDMRKELAELRRKDDAQLASPINDHAAD